VRTTRTLAAIFTAVVPLAGWLAAAPSPAVAGTAAPATARSAARVAGGRAGSELHVCPISAQPGVMACQAVIQLPSQAQLASRHQHPGQVYITGYGPAQLRSAYQLAAAARRGGHGATVAVVDVGSNPAIARNLAAYRDHFGLPACTTATGCLRIVNQLGAASPLPGPNPGWGVEESLDLEMVSAICPNCHLLLVEADTADIADLARAEQAAAGSGARFISNSWDGAEFPGERSYDEAFDHPGDAVTVSAGDYGYATNYPAVSQFVTAVGGTSLRRDPSVSRGWVETVWGSAGPGSRYGNSILGGTASGCSIFEAKPSWQRERVDDSPTGCLNRTDNDVAADANPATGVTVYDSYGTVGDGGPWLQLGGTSVGAPLIAAVYALAGSPAADTYPASYLYQAPRDFFDVTRGEDGDCEADRKYLCHAEPGYDGPTGFGTPDGTAGFAEHDAEPVTLVDPGTQDVAAGSRFSLRIRGLDARAGAASLSYQATGLPAGLSISAGPRSTSAVITGTLPARPASRLVTVTAKDPYSGQTGSTRFMIVTVGSLTTASPVPGRISVDEGRLCLDDDGGGPGGSVTVSPCTGSVAEQQWTFASDGAPGGPVRIADGRNCLAVIGAAAALATCRADSAAQQWTQANGGMLRNGLRGGCLAAVTEAAGARLALAPCRAIPPMQWTLPAGLLVSGVAGLCVYSSGYAGIGTRVPVDVAGCDAGRPGEMWAEHSDGSIQAGSGCLDEPGIYFFGTALDGVAAIEDYCEENVDQSQVWLTGPGGELVNNYSGRCLDDVGDGRSGSALEQEDCYGEASEIWAVN
jgi:hypothetical protein